MSCLNSGDNLNHNIVDKLDIAKRHFLLQIKSERFDQLVQTTTITVFNHLKFTACKLVFKNVIQRYYIHVRLHVEPRF